MNNGVQEYIDKVEDNRKELFYKLQDLILRLFPESERRISYQVVVYQIPTGNVWLGYWKHGVSLYTGFISKIAEFKEKYPDIKTGKGCLNLKMTDEIPWQEIEDLVSFVMTHKLKRQ
ncbi:MAG: DUF1801 domain-containing protein [Candidatus Cloacimonetes bacterium]|nr:DUF1801 domain-containing protein [Candidatus Cloacimonadota bacterium]